MFGRLPKPLRWVARILTVLLVLAILLAGVVTWAVRTSFPQLSGEVTLRGLTKPVTIYRDRYGVPHLYADTSTDLFKAQGYVHAQDRFWEMDFRRKTTAGRLSELFGESTLDIDKVVRTLGWRRTAEQEVKLLSPATMTYLQAYADGVNAWMAQHEGRTDKSLEYAILSLTNRAYKPEPWTPIDSVAWLKAMAWDLRSNLDAELERAIAATKLPVDRVDQLWPDYPYAKNRPIVTEGTVANGTFTTTKPVTAGIQSSAVRAALAAVRLAPALIGSQPKSSGIGSNSWVISGSRTTTGKPILANDPHLSQHMPSIWYQAGLHCRTRGPACPFDLTGFTFSGLPGVVIGRNHRISWGFTNLGPDVADTYLERLAGGAYEIKGHWLPLETRTETIKVSGGGPVTLAIRSTRHGPLISDVMETARKATPGASYGVALRWTAMEPGRTADGLFLFGAAENWQQFREAAKVFEVPSQNLIYADTDGNIGYQAPGKIPVRTKGDGRWPVPGWTGEYEWKGYIPFGELPNEANPARGYIVTANNAVIGPSYQPLLTKDWAYGYRSQRVINRVEEALSRGAVDLAKVADISQDTRNDFAPALVPHLLRVNGPRAREVLTGWDFTQGRESAPAAYFNAVWRQVLIRTFNDQLPEGARPGGGDRWYEVMLPLLDRPGDAWWDDVRTPGTERRDDILKQAMSKANDELTDRLGGDPKAWRWGDLHTLTLTNDTFGTSGIGPIEWLFNRGPIPVSGGEDAVNATGWNAQEGYQVPWVPSMRMVVDLADAERSRWVNLTGASGHAFHANYWDQSSLWALGKTIPMRSSEAAVKRDAANTLTLKP